MSHSKNNLSGLSPEEKRKLLLNLLKDKGQEPHSHPSPTRGGVGAPDPFTVNVTDLNAEAILDPTIQPGAAEVQPGAEPAHLFLTGATGFLGSFLLHELLEQTPADIHCLVRCSTVEEGKKRILKTLETYIPGSNPPRSRIIPVPGDLSQPLFGMASAEFQALASQVDCVYHCGAAVSWISPYSRLKPGNVFGTQEALRLACQGKVKPFHYISSISVFPLVTDGEAKVVNEQDSLDHGGILYGGYTQSKWVAEKLVTTARSRGLPAAIYRPGLITGHSRTGAWNTDDILCKMLKSWIELRTAPDLDAGTDMTPVDYVSKAIIHLSRQRSALGKAFHLVNPRPVHVRDMVSWVCSFGYPIELIPYDRWRADLMERASTSRWNAAFSLAPLFSMRLSENEPRARLHEADGLDRLGTVIVSQYAASSVQFDSRNTLTGLEGSSIICPPIDAHVFEVYLSYFNRSGFLK